MKKTILVALVLALTLVMALPMANVTASDHNVQFTPQYFFAAHAVVVNGCNQETAWADCNNSQNFTGGNWAWYFSYPGNEGGGQHDQYGVDDNAWGLYAGKNTQIGWVRVNITPSTVTVRFETFDGWLMTETHLAVVTAAQGWEKIPQTKSGNPKVGNFLGLDGEKSVRTFEPPQQVVVYSYPIAP
jgi:hypothetical protein